MARQPRSAARSAAGKTAPRGKRSVAKTAGAPAAVPAGKCQEAYATAVALYEKGLLALQRREFAVAATSFRRLLDQYPEELELHDRARLYLNVCERETEPKAKPPETADEQLLAATLAINRGDVDEALSLLHAAAAARPKDGHVQYLLALAHAQRDDADTAARHLRTAIKYNPQNRVQARQEPDFDSIRTKQPFLAAIGYI